MHGLWSTNIPSRFLDELPEEHVEVTESKGGFGGYGGYGASRFDEMESFRSNYGTPGWQRAQANRARSAKSNDEAGDYAAREGVGGGGSAYRSPPSRAGEGQGGGAYRGGRNGGNRRPP